MPSIWLVRKEFIDLNWPKGGITQFSFSILHCKIKKQVRLSPDHTNYLLHSEILVVERIFLYVTMKSRFFKHTFEDTSWIDFFQDDAHL